MRFIQTGHRIRDELRSIPGAIRYEPQHRNAGGGQEPRNVLPLYDAEEVGREGTLNAVEMEPSVVDADQPGEFVEGVVSQAAQAELAEAIAAAGDGSDRIRVQVALEGVDALGWYATLHQDAVQWGVYLKAEGVLWLASTVFLPVARDPVLAVRLALRAIHDHELMHFAEDWATAQLELLLDRPVWWPIRESAHFDKVRPSSERLANGYMLRRARSLPRILKCRGAYSALAEWTLGQGEGYRDGSQLVGTQLKFDLACWVHLGNAVGWSNGNPDVIRADLHRLYPFAPHVDWRYCPVRVVADDAKYATLLASLFIQQIPHIQETPRFCSMLEARPRQERKAWPKVRAQLAQTTRLPGLDFKPWARRGKGWYSVRVTKAGRAHLRFESATQRWFAEEIGSHREMGHG